ncbi:hypothetical protein Rctr197k_032 [Virus Rctr197k]|nr:hypothetical protein Rctr197k_032 [Virus Rctr197k]
MGYHNDLAELAAQLQARRHALRRQLDRVDKALECIRSPPASGPVCEFVLQEAKYLSAVYTTGIARDPVTGLARCEIAQRLLHLQALFGAPVRAVVAVAGIQLTSSSI